jgi:calcineurin-like phosphoesterase
MLTEKKVFDFRSITCAFCSWATSSAEPGAPPFQSFSRAWSATGRSISWSSWRNSAGGSGITEAIYRELIDAGADATLAITPGTSAKYWSSRTDRLRPLNFPRGTPAAVRRWSKPERQARAHVNAIGRVFMTPFDDPFACINRELDPAASARRRTLSVDFHCEATSEKQAIGFFCDGRASLVVGTHPCRPPTTRFCPAAPRT